MSESVAVSRILIVANRTAATPALLEAVQDRARQGEAEFHLVVPAAPNGLHRIVDPEDHGIGEAETRLAEVLPLLSAAAGSPVSGHVGDSNPISAIEDAIHTQDVDEIIISTLRRKFSAWIKLDLPAKASAYGRPVHHVEPDGVDACVLPLVATG